VVDSLEEILPIYEVGSSRIALFADSEMRMNVVRFGVRESSMVLDLGSGPGTLARAASEAGGTVVQLDVSRKMLERSPGSDRIQAVFEALPFRSGAFDSVIAGFSLRDARDLLSAVGQIRRVLRKGGRFAFCDLGKPDSFVRVLAVAIYLRVVVPLIGMTAGGRKGFAFGSLFDTYVLALHNSQLVALLKLFFTDVRLDAKQAGAAIVVGCVA